MSKPLWDKTEVLLGTYGGRTWEFRESHENMMRTHWEQREKQTIPLTPPPKKKKWTPHERMLSIGMIGIKV